MKKLITAIIMLLFCLCSFGQTIRYHAYKEQYGLMDKQYCIYAYGEWKKSNHNIVINLSDSNFRIDNVSYEIIDKPCHWKIKNTYKYTSFSCISNNLTKVQVKLFIFDNKNRHPKLIIMDERKSTKYVVVQY